MRKLWVSYAWADDEGGDVEWVCQQIENTGIWVRRDRWDIRAGRRLWQQIAKFITDPAECDAWAFYATQTSINSEPCLEELEYALNRALKERGGSFPLITIARSRGDISLFPPAVSSRLCVVLEDREWLERIKAEVEQRSPSIRRNELTPFVMKTYRAANGFYIEVRPRAGTWHPFMIGIPVEEKDRLSQPDLARGPSDHRPMGGMLNRFIPDLTSNDGKWFLVRSGDAATPSMSFFLCCKELPSEILFGQDGMELYVTKPNPPS